MAANRPEGHVPNVPAWTAVGLPDRTAFSMISVRDSGDAATVGELKAELTEGPDTPDHFERARIVNTDERVTVFLGYWTDPEAQLRWCRRSQALNRPGVLKETAVIPADRWETLHSTPEITPGVRNLLAAELTDVHEYWGAARDRIPASATSDLAPEPADPLPGNLCLIRSGQVWEYCGEAERTLYFTDVEPNLTAGIDYLAEHPETGCISSRFLREQTIDGEDLESTSFVGWFRDLESLEDWSRTHPTHLAIFNSFLAMESDLGFEVDLRLWHEVAVIPAAGVQVAGTVPSPLSAAL
ncbi:MAG: phenylacetaldoxime dehydratase family protein [Acidimicrobiaceae bacterium]|nr:phenylacetaldoxime dehydratase family protein [Acidimicrobiaceae bacterium]